MISADHCSNDRELTMGLQGHKRKPLGVSWRENEIDRRNEWKGRFRKWIDWERRRTMGDPRMEKEKFHSSLKSIKMRTRDQISGHAFRWLGARSGISNYQYGPVCQSGVWNGDSFPPYSQEHRSGTWHHSTTAQRISIWWIAYNKPDNGSLFAWRKKTRKQLRSGGALEWLDRYE